MAEFAYVALAPDGSEKKGRLRAADMGAARTRLESRRFYPLSIEATAARNQADMRSIFQRQPRMSAKQLALFTRQLASLISVSPLAEALQTLARQNEKREIREIVEAVHDGVVEGQQLADAMKRREKSFPPLYRAMISAGENSGALPLIMERLATLLERQVAMRGKLIGALIYPAVLSLVALVVVALLMITVVPRVVEQFEGVDQQLPFLTRLVIGMSAFLGYWWWLILLFVAATIAATAFGLRRYPEFKYRFDAALLRLPLAGKLLRNLNGARMARTLSTMVASRLPVLEGLRLTSRTISNDVLRKACETMVESIRGGGSLSGAMRAVGVFPPLLVYLASSGENAGQLDTMLERAADYLEREFDDFSSTALTLLEPLIIIFMGGAVAIIILAILLPILQLQSLVGA